MTINQLLKETYALGFEETGEIDSAFLFAASRALGQILSELADEKRRGIIVSPPTLTHYTASISHKPGEEISFILKGRCLSFKSFGLGNISIEDDNGKRLVGFGDKDSVTKQFFKDECTLTFTGDRSYLITDLAAFSTNNGNDKVNIPIYSEFTEIDLCERISDIAYVTGIPTDSRGRRIEGAYTVGNTLYLPREFSGEALITYKPHPSPITSTDPNKAVDIPKPLAHLLPILTASYLWLDDDPEKAEYYAAIYRSEASRISYSARRSTCAGYSDVTGWA